MPFSLTILGSSSAIPSIKRFPTAQVLHVHERFFLIDCGEGTQIQLKRFAINILRIHHIFISHLHGDHVFGLFGLLSSFNLLNRKSDLHIYAHQDLEATLEHFKKYFSYGLPFTIIFHPFVAVKHMQIYEDKHITVEIVPLRHSIPVAGFIFKEKKMPLNIRKEAIEKFKPGIKDMIKIKEGNDFVDASGNVVKNSELTLPPYKPRSFAFCTDTLYFSKLINTLKDIDLLYFEATFATKDKKIAKLTGHSTSVQAATIAKEANVGKLLIGHFSTRYKSVDSLLHEAKEIFSETYAVNDGDEYLVNQVRIDQEPA